MSKKEESKEEEQSSYQELEKKVTYSSKNIWEEIDEETFDQIFTYAENYKKFLDRSKTERLTVKWILEQACKNGYQDLLEQPSIHKAGAYYILNRNKNIALIKVGEKPLQEGINFVIAHGDAPRLDLKQVPLIEDTEIAMLKTHYYGGIKKYHWLNIPLALSGVVVTRDNKRIELEIGFEENDPVFIIPDLLPHLWKKVQGEKKASEFIEGENLNLFFGNIPIKDPGIKEKVKLAVLQRLNQKYGIIEEDLVSAELEAVPAIKPRDVGIDRALIGGYAHDDRVSVYGAVTSIFDANHSNKTKIVFIVDKEEIGSDGSTGAKSMFIYHVVGTLLEKTLGAATDNLLRQTMEKSLCISADVNGAINPMYKSVHDEKNSSKISHGLVLTKYTGARGKYGASDADAELTGYIRYLLNKHGIFWQYGSLGKVDEGGGGTIAKYFALYNASVIDCGVPVIGMHSPYEIISKADLFYSSKAYRVFLEEA